VKFVDNSL